MINREKIGIAGIDSMMQGGLPKSSVISLSGPPGVGKSILALHYVLEGARRGQKCVYLSVEEPCNNIKNTISQFDFAEEFLELEKKGLIVIKCFDYPEYEVIYTDLLNKILKSKNIKRLVIDAFNSFFVGPFSSKNLKNEHLRKILVDSFMSFRKSHTTTLLVNEETKSEFDLHVPYLVDGVISLDFISLGSLERRIFIPKMRWTNQFDSTKAYEIGTKGITVIEEESLD